MSEAKLTLTREQIEEWRQAFCDGYITKDEETLDELEALCTMALSSIAMREALVFVYPALLVLRTMCDRAGPGTRRHCSG